ncbi:hypothetical protein GX441_11375 [bacterium]|nr:hypothetical protein [bacterium]
MKKTLFFIFLGGLLLIPSAMKADEYTTMKDIMLDLASYVTYLEDSLDQEIVHMQADIIGADGLSYTRTLRSGWTYGITAFGDWRISDLDITVYKNVDGSWVEIEKDEEVDNNPTVTVVPSSDGEYKIELDVYEWDGDYTAAHYGLIVFHEMQ